MPAFLSSYAYRNSNVINPKFSGMAWLGDVPDEYKRDKDEITAEISREKALTNSEGIKIEAVMAGDVPGVIPPEHADTLVLSDNARAGIHRKRYEALARDAESLPSDLSGLKPDFSNGKEVYTPAHMDREMDLHAMRKMAEEHAQERWNAGKIMQKNGEKRSLRDIVWDLLVYGPYWRHV